MTDPVPPKEDPCAGQACENTDRHLWPIVSKFDDPYESIHVTKEGNIGINVCGNVIVQSLRAWHAAAGGTSGRALGDEQRPSKELLPEVDLTPEQIARLDALHAEVVLYPWSAARLIVHLQTALTGISTCSTCEACRGAATLALGGAAPEPAVGHKISLDGLEQLLLRESDAPVRVLADGTVEHISAQPPGDGA